jgi:hypothetical protein
MSRSITYHDSIGHSYSVHKERINPDYEYLLNFYKKDTYRGKVWYTKLQSIPVNYLAYSRKTDIVEFKAVGEFHIPEKFDVCEYVELPLDEEDRNKLAVATVFRPMIDENANREVNLMRDMFYFKLELHGANFKVKNNLITAKVGYWLATQ